MPTENTKNLFPIKMASTLTAYRNSAEDQLEKSSETLVKALEDAQKKCSARTISAHEICEELLFIDSKLNLPKKYMEGIEIYVDLNAQNFPNAYKYRPESTVFTAIYKRGEWQLTGIYRATTRRANHGHEIILTPEAKEQLLNQICNF